MPPLSAMDMNIGGSEWAIIIILGLILLFDSKRLTGVSRILGKAAGEYEKGRLLFRKEMEDVTKAVNAKTYFAAPKITGPVASEREKLEAIASSLGVDHIGKTDDQLRSMISKRIQD
jgi:sec-independent protein translocase protein TatA